MENGKGWKLSAALVAKQFGKLGGTIAEALANFDPETATQVDRDALQARLREVAMKLAGARVNAVREQKEAIDLKAQIDQDTVAAAVLIKKFEEGVVDEATLQDFADELEANKARLPQEEQEAVDAKQIVATIEEVLETLQQRLDQFDRKASEIKRRLALATAQKEKEELRLQNQNELASMRRGMADTSTALGALSRRADKLTVEAAGTKILADGGQKVVDRQKAVSEARNIASGQSTAGVSAADRLRRLTEAAPT